MSAFRRLMVAALLLGGTAALAEENGRGRPLPPPQEAFDACVGLGDYSSCLVRLKDHEVKGTCHATPEAKLVCVPVAAPPPPSPFKH
jgi:hypothetical protein